MMIIIPFVEIKLYNFRFIICDKTEKLFKILFVGINVLGNV